MIKYVAVLALVIVPLLWGALMVPVLDFFENLIFKQSGKGGYRDE